MKKQLLLTLGFVLSISISFAQQKVKDGSVTGTALPNKDALLELESTNKGLLNTRVALVQTTSPAPLSAHVAGMMVYNTATSGDVTPGVYYNDGTKWVKTQTGVVYLVNGTNTTVTGTGTLADPFKINTGKSTIAQNLTTGVITHTNEAGDIKTANVVSANTGNALTVGTDGGAVLSSAAFPIVTSNNGLTKLGTNIQLGGELTKPTTIVADPTNTLAIKGLQTGVATDKIVVADPITGILKTVDATNLSNDWHLTGNSSTNPALNFLGTIDATDFLIKTANTERIRVTAAGNIDIPNSTITTGIITKNGVPFIHNLKNSPVSESTAVGENALNLNATGFRNSAFGSRALASVTSGQENTALGRNALTSNTIGSSNVAVGQRAMEANTIGYNNVAVGRSALTVMTGGIQNTAVGNYAGFQLEGKKNTIVGYYAGFSQLSVDGTVLIGNEAGSANLLANRLMIANDGRNNPLIDGDFANNVLTINKTLKVADLATGASVSTGNRAVVADANGQLMIGAAAAVLTADNGLTKTLDNVQLGGALTKATTVTTDATNTLALVGLQTGSDADKVIVQDATTGQLKNIVQIPVDLRLIKFNGNKKYDSHITQDAGVGSNGTSVGTGGRNFAIGVDNLSSLTTGGVNIAIGSQSLISVTDGNYNTGIGTNSLQNLINGVNNTAMGWNAINTLKTGSNNLALGWQSLAVLATGDNNTVVGTRAGLGVLGSSNTMLGFYTGFGTKGSGNVLLGNLVGNTDAGSNRLMIDNSDTTTPLLDGNFTSRVLKVNNTLKVADLGIAALATTGNRAVVADANGQLMIGTAAATVTASNGLNKFSNDIQLGGSLTKATVITTDATNTLAVAGLQSGATIDSLVVADPTTGLLKRINQTNLIVEPWNVENTTIKAKLNNQNIYQNGNVGVGDFSATAPIAKLDVRGAIRGGVPSIAVVGVNSFAYGLQAEASAQNSFAGGFAGRATGDGSIAIGGFNSFPLQPNIASGLVSAAIGGAGNTAAALTSFATGLNNTIDAGANTAFVAGEGNKIAATGKKSFAMGQGNVVNSSHSVVFGTNNVVNNVVSNVFGVDNQSSSLGEMVFGARNAIIASSGTGFQNVGSDPILQVGNGNFPVNIISRNNALTLLRNGSLGLGITGVEAAAKPTERLDVGSGNVRVRDINTVIGSSIDKIVVADINGVLKTVAPNSVGATITANNGLTKTLDNIQLGGSLTKATVITTDATNTLALSGLQTGGATDSLLVAATNGIVKRVAQVTVDLRKIGRNHITQDAGFGSTGSSLGSGYGQDNIAIGDQVLNSGVTVNANTAIGSNSMALLATGKYNTGIGRNTLSKMVTGEDNNAIGWNSLTTLTTGYRNLGISVQSLAILQTGNYNIGLGWQTGGSLISGSNNLFLGNRAGGTFNGSNRLMIDNTGTSSNTPLVDGDFSTKILKINNTLQVADLGIAALATTGNRAVVADANGQLMIGTAAAAPAIDTKAASYILLTADETILVDATIGAVTITLPAASALNKGKKYTVKKIDTSANGATVISAGGTIDGNAAATGVTGTLSYQGWVFQSDGANWFIVSRI